MGNFKKVKNQKAIDAAIVGNSNTQDMAEEFRRAMNDAASMSDTRAIHDKIAAVEEAVWLTENLLTFSDFCESADHMNFPPLSDRQRMVAEYMFGTDPKHVFDNNRNTAVLVWGKGGGKDTIAALAKLYIVYILLQIKNPQKYLGLPDNVSIDLLNVAASKQQAQMVYFQILKTLTLNWPWLRSRYDLVINGRFFSSGQADEDALAHKVTVTNDAIIFPKNIRAFSGSCEAESLEGKNLLCFSGDTKVSLVDGREVEIRDLCSEERFWVYSFDGEKIVPAIGRAARKTRSMADTVLVTLDNGESIRCTPDHLFMTRDGKYKGAASLASGDSLMPLHRKYGRTELYGYELLYQPYDNSYHHTHREFWAQSSGSSRKQVPGHVIHHINFNKKDNTPTNLRLMESSAHLRLHGETHGAVHKEWHRLHPEHAVKISRIMPGRKVSIETRKKISASRLGVEMPEHVRRKISEKNSGMTRSVETRNNITAAQAAMRIDGRAAVKGSKISAALTGRVRTEEHCKNLGISKRKEIAMLSPEEYYNRFATRTKHRPTTSQLEEIRAKLYGMRVEMGILNHRVVSVVPAGACDVYDLTVDGHHNFALSSGVFVHNCFVLDEADAFKSGSQIRSAAKIYRTVRTSAVSRFGMRYKGFIISYPRSVNGFIMTMYKNSLKFLNMYGDIAKTWEVKPRTLFSPETFEFEGHQVPMDFYEDFRLDPNGSKSAYICDPPEIESLFLDDPSKIDLATAGSGRPLFDFKDSKNHEYVKKEIIRAPFMYRKSINHILVLDLSLNKNSTALTLMHRDEDKIVIDFCTAWVPEPRLKLEVDLQNVEDIIGKVKESVSVKALYCDRWNCLSGDTIIPLFDGRKLTMRELERKYPNGGFRVYSIDGDRVVASMASAVKKTYESAPMLRVALDNGESVIATPEHRFMMRDGSYREAGDLRRGDTLMPLYTRISEKSRDGMTGDEKVYHPDGKWGFTHHASSRSSEFRKNALAAGKKHSPNKFTDIAKAGIAKSIREEWEGPEYREKMKNTPGRAEYKNHSVVSVEPCGNYDAYDIEVPGTQNFAIGQGIFVHNSALLVQKLRGQGMLAETVKLGYEDFELFKRLLYAGNIILPKNERLLKELKSLQQATKQRVSKTDGSHSDMAITVVMGVKMLAKTDTSDGGIGLLAEGEFVGDNLTGVAEEYDDHIEDSQPGLTIDGIPL